MGGGGGGCRHGDGVPDRRGRPALLGHFLGPMPQRASAGVGMRDGPLESVHRKQQPDERAFQTSACPPWTRITTSPRRMPSLRDGSRDGQRVRVTRPSTFSSRTIQDAALPLPLGEGLHQPLADLPHELLGGLVLDHGAQAPARPGPPASPLGPVAASPTASSTQAWPPRPVPAGRGRPARRLRARSRGPRSPPCRTVVEQPKEQVRCDQRHRADGTTRD